MMDKLWFVIYDFTASTPNRSDFEHVFVGEQNSQNNLEGITYFWHQDYLDDKVVPGYANEQDNVQFLGVKCKV